MAGENREQITNFVLDYIALEGARYKFDTSLPADNDVFKQLYSDLEKVGFPQKWSREQDNYECVIVNLDTTVEIPKQITIKSTKLIRLFRV